MKSVRTKIICLVLSCLLLSAIAIGGAGIVNTKKGNYADSIEIMNLLCTVKAGELDSLFSEIELSVGTLKTYTVSQLDSVEKLKTDNAYVESYTRSLLDIALNAAQNTKGAMAVYIRYNPEFTDPESGLFYSRLNNRGDFVKQAPTNFSQYDPSDIEHVGWFYIPAESKKGTWIAPYYNKNINVEMISYVIPIYAEGIFVGVVGMDIDFGVLQDIVAGTEVYETGYAFLTDKNANVLYHKDLPPGTVLDTFNNGEFKEFAMELRNDAGSENLLSYSYEGEQKKATFQRLTNDMRFVLTASSSEIDERANILIGQIVIWTALIVLIYIGISIIVTKRLTKPLIELNLAAQKIAEGDLSVTISHKSKDEIGTLSESFRKTAANLEKYIEYINGLAYRDLLTGVKNRTAYLELAGKMDELIRLKNPEFALVVFDVNGLKDINDTYGHDFGDILIAESSNIICRAFKKCPVYRIGGDEFVTILEGGALENYGKLLKMFQRELDNYNQHPSNDIQISIARGIAVYSPQSDYTFGDVFKRADGAMYQNKAEMKKKL